MLTTRRFALAGTILAVLFALLFSMGAPPRVAEAQSIKPELHATGHFDVSTIAVVITGTTDLQVRVTKMYLTTATAGLVRFTDGTPSTWYLGSVNLYLVANVPTEVPDAIAQKIKTATAGNSIKCQGPGILFFDINYTN